jgi:phosphoesterase RecJ-like protein
MTLDDIYEEMRSAQTVVIMAHENPDGDAIGSCLGLCLALKNMGKDVDVLMRNYPRTFSYLPGLEFIKETTDVESYDLAFTLDCPDLNRVCEDYQPVFNNAKVTVEFDHHMNNAMFADYNIVDHVNPATCQILAHSFQYLGIEITKEIATCLITGIITDTGGFRNTGTNVDTFDFASTCLEIGVNFTKIYRDAMCVISKAKFEAQKICMDRMEFFHDGKIAFTYLNLEDDERIGVEDGDHDGIVDIGRSIEGVEVSIFLYQRGEGYKASLRSNDYVNVAEICQTFGGGGHIRAAGATLNMSLEDAKNAIIAEVDKAIK